MHYFSETVFANIIAEVLPAKVRQHPAHYPAEAPDKNDEYHTQSNPKHEVYVRRSVIVQTEHPKINDDAHHSGLIEIDANLRYHKQYRAYYKCPVLPDVTKCAEIFPVHSLNPCIAVVVS